MKRVFISVINDLVTDQRVQRIVSTLGNMNMKVMLIGRKLPGSPNMPDVTFRYRRMRMLFKKGPFFYAFFNLRLFFLLITCRKPGLFWSNDLDTLPANFLASRIRRVPLIYDSHEYFTEVPELAGRNFVRGTWTLIERRLLPSIKHAVTVSGSIADAYKDKYGTPFCVIRNLPAGRTPVADPGFNDNYPSRYKMIYQGALNLGRGIELMIEAMQFIPDTMLLIVGDGDIRDQLRKKVIDMKLGDRVFFPGRVPPDQLYRITCQCHLGLSLEEDLGLNYRFALPNKVFDYIQARIPVLCSDLPEMSELVRSYGVGEICSERTPEGIAAQALQMLTRTEGKAQLMANLDKAAAELCWENEEGKLQSMVRSAIEGGRRG